MNQKVYWLSDPPKQCDLTGVVQGLHASVDKEFVDGATCFGPWANMCSYCHAQYGRGLGTGKGQKYKKQPDGKWLKIAG